MYASKEDMLAWSAFSVLPDDVGMEAVQQVDWKDFAAFFDDKCWAVASEDEPEATRRREDGKGMLDMESCVSRLAVEEDLESLIGLFSEETDEERKVEEKEDDLSSERWTAESGRKEGDTGKKVPVRSVCPVEDRQSVQDRAERARKREELERGLVSLLPSVNMDSTGVARGLPVGLGRVVVPFGSEARLVVLPAREAESKRVRRSARLGGEVKVDEEGEAFEPVRQFESLEQVWEEPRFENVSSLARDFSRPARRRYRAWATRRWLEKRRVREGKKGRDEVKGRLGATLRVLRKKAQTNGNRFGKFVIPVVGKGRL